MRQTLDSLFRRTHNLKAAAAADGLQELTTAAHELENVLHSLRTGSATLNDDLLQQLTEQTENLPLIPADLWNSLKAEEKHTLSQCIKEGARIFLVHATFDITDFDQQFQKLKELLNSTGEVISTAPKVENNKINFRIIYAGDLPLELTEISDVTCSELHHRESSFVGAALGCRPFSDSTKARPRGAAPTISLVAVVQRAVRAGEAAAVALGKTIKFELIGENLDLEESLCDTIANPLIHLVRNAVDHGIDREGTITIEAALTPTAFTLKVTDDGRGIDQETIASGRLFEPGFSTASEVSEISGRGVGLDVVKTAIEEAGGSVNVTSKLGEGCCFELTLPKS